MLMLSASSDDDLKTVWGGGETSAGLANGIRKRLTPATTMQKNDYRN